MNKWKSLYRVGSDDRKVLLGFELTITVYKSVTGEDVWTKTPIEHNLAVPLTTPPSVTMPQFLSTLTNEKEPK